MSYKDASNVSVLPILHMFSDKMNFVFFWAHLSGGGAHPRESSSLMLCSVHGQRICLLLYLITQLEFYELFTMSEHVVGACLRV